MNVLQCVALPKNTKENHKISVFRLIDSDPKNFYYVDIVRLVMSMLDARLVHCDENELIDGEVGIIDVSGFGFRHFTQVITNISILKAYSRYVQVKSKNSQVGSGRNSLMYEKFEFFLNDFLHACVIYLQYIFHYKQYTASTPPPEMLKI